MPLLARVTEEGTEQELGEHLSGVATSARRLVARKRFRFESLTAAELERFAYILGAAHDFGKGTLYFQRYIRPDYDSPADHKKRHSSLSAYYAYYALRQEGFTPEIAVLGWFVVQRHHGNLTSLFGENGELHSKADDPSHRDSLKVQVESIRKHTESALEDCYRGLADVEYVAPFLERMIDGDLIETVRRLRFTADQSPGVEAYYLVLLLYSVLLDADKMDSAGVSFENWPSVGPDEVTALDEAAVEEYKRAELTVDSDLDEQRERASQYVEAALDTLDSDERLLSLTMPTGSGKTLTALNAALRLRNSIDSERRPRIIYSAPFLSIIDQNHDVYSDVLEAAGIDRDPSVLLRHDHTSAGYAATADDSEETDSTYYSNPDRALLLTEGWNGELVTTTFVQLFETLVTNRNADARRFHKLANSIVLIDEVQAVPTKYWGVIREALLVLTEMLNSYVILLTATNPLLFEPGEEITELTSQSDAVDEVEAPSFEQLDRVAYRFDSEPTSIDSLVSDVVNRTSTHAEEDVMVVLNTISSTREVYERVRPEVGRETVYLSTHVLPRERQRRIDRIVASEEPLLVVTTQLVEAGVDIDIDTIYRDFAPVDSIVQTAGRCNRENEQDRGSVRVVRLRDDRENASREYYHQYVYDAVLVDATKSVIEGFPSTVSESRFNAEAVQTYFKLVADRKTTDGEEVVPAMRSIDGEETSISLIQEDYQTVPVFVEIDSTATAAYEDVKDIYETYDGYARRGRLLGPKTEFYSHVINVPVPGNEDELSTLPSTFLESIRWIRDRHIGRDENRHWYHPETGFRIPESTVFNQLV